jgi:hypothetical protein
MTTSLTARDRRELAKFLGDIQVHLNRCPDPEAIRLLRRFFADENGTNQVVRSGPEDVVYLGAGAGGPGGGFKLDMAGHALADYQGAGDHCLRCTALLIEAGDLSADWPAELFKPDERHRAIQHFILDNPGIDFLTAMRAVEAAGGRS